MWFSPLARLWHSQRWTIKCVDGNCERHDMLRHMAKTFSVSMRGNECFCLFLNSKKTAACCSTMAPRTCCYLHLAPSRSLSHSRFRGRWNRIAHDPKPYEALLELRQNAIYLWLVFAWIDAKCIKPRLLGRCRFVTIVYIGVMHVWRTDDCTVSTYSIYCCRHRHAAVTWYSGVSYCVRVNVQQLWQDMEKQWHIVYTTINPMINYNDFPTIVYHSRFRVQGKDKRGTLWK